MSHPSPLLRRISYSTLLTTPPHTSSPSHDDTLQTTREILQQVKSGGEDAIKAAAVKFGDLPDISTPYFLTPTQLRAAYDTLPHHQQQLLTRIATRIRTFATAQRTCLNELKIPVAGGFAGHTCVPIEVAGCYAPGGRFPLPSSVMMTAITARVAGVEKVFVASPRPAEITKAAAYISGADGLLCIGGAHAIGALVYGIPGLIPPVDIVCGPGNKWVTAAKQLVAGKVAIDMLAGPSELLIFTDGSSSPRLIAADLLAQAEHDTEAIPMLITTDETIIDQVNEELERQLDELPTKATAGEALRNGFIVHVSSLSEGIAACNYLAAEHLELLLRNAIDIAPQLKHYGGLFIGEAAAEVIGDYGAGPNHTLPTARTSRYSGGLSVFNFIRIRTWLQIDDASQARGVVQDSVDLAILEGLIGHSRSAQQRLIDMDDEEWTVVNHQNDPLSLIRPDFRSLMEYEPVKPLEVLAREIGIPVTSLAKLNANENLYGPVPEAVTALTSAIHHIYPDPDQNALRDAIASYTSFSRQQIVCGSGSDEMIDLVFRLCDPRVVVTASPSFPMYKFFAQLNKSRVVDVPRHGPPSWSINVDGIIQQIQQGATMVFLASPNNPTGDVLSHDDISTLCESSALIVIDEAYAEFANSTALDLINTYPNLVVLRTFSKWAGLAGLRCGYAVAHPSLCRRMMQIKQPYNLNVAADAAARASLTHSHRLQHAITHILHERTRLMSRLSTFKWLHPLPSNANFILVQVDGMTPRELQAKLHKEGVLVRCYATPDGTGPLAHYIRISCGRPQDTDRLLTVLHTIDAEVTDDVDRAYIVPGISADVGHPPAGIVMEENVIFTADGQFLPHRQHLIDIASRTPIALISTQSRVEIESILSTYHIRSIMGGVIAHEDMEQCKHIDPVSLALERIHKLDYHTDPTSRIYVITSNASTIARISHLSPYICPIGITSDNDILTSMYTYGASRVFSSLRSLRDHIMGQNQNIYHIATRDLDRSQPQSAATTPRDRKHIPLILSPRVIATARQEIGPSFVRFHDDINGEEKKDDDDDDDDGNVSDDELSIGEDKTSSFRQHQDTHHTPSERHKETGHHPHHVHHRDHHTHTHVRHHGHGHGGGHSHPHSQPPPVDGYESEDELDIGTDTTTSFRQHQDTHHALDVHHKETGHPIHHTHHRDHDIHRAIIRGDHHHHHHHNGHTHQHHQRRDSDISLDIGAAAENTTYRQHVDTHHDTHDFHQVTGRHTLHTIERNHDIHRYVRHYGHDLEFVPSTTTSTRTSPITTPRVHPDERPIFATSQVTKTPAKSTSTSTPAKSTSTSTSTATYQTPSKSSKSPHKTATSHTRTPTQVLQCSIARVSRLTRSTSATHISIDLCLDGHGHVTVSTGVPLLDDVFRIMGTHGGWDVTLECRATAPAVESATIDDVAISLGLAFHQALGTHSRLKSVADAMAPVQDALARAVVDISGTAYAQVNLAEGQVKFNKQDKQALEMFSHCLSSFAHSASLTLHVDILRGSDVTHRIESAFKATAVALRQATIRMEEQRTGR